MPVEAAGESGLPAATRPSGMSLSEAASLWAAEPDVIADPSQTEHGRVWTRARDVLPGREVHPGQVLHAAFGDLSFHATGTWDGTELGTLWLTPLGPTSGRPRINVEDLRDELARAREAGPSADRLEAWVEDLVATVQVLVEAVDAQRRTARELVDLLGGLDARTARALRSDALLDRVHRQARLPRVEPL